jgi:hypothetical protein
MEVKQEYSKRPRLDSWPSSQQIDSAILFQQNTSHSPPSQYSSTSPMVGWGDSNKPRSQSMSGGGSGGGPSNGGSSIGKAGHCFSSYAPVGTVDSHLPPFGHSLSVDSNSISPPLTSEAQGFNGFQPQQSDIGTNTANSSPPSQVMARQQLKPLQTAQTGGYHDATSFFQQIPQGAQDHRGSMSADMTSPGSSTVGPGVMVGGYGGVQNHQLIGASSVGPSPVGAQGGIVLGGAQGMNVVTTYPPRRKAIRAAQVSTCPQTHTSFELIIKGLRCMSSSKSQM